MQPLLLMLRPQPHQLARQTLRLSQLLVSLTYAAKDAEHCIASGFSKHAMLQRLLWKNKASWCEI